MLFRWILTAPGKPMRRGVNVPADDMPSEGETLHLVSTEGSMAIRDGVLLVDGQTAAPGEYRAEFADGILIIVCVEGGAITDRQTEPLPDEEEVTEPEPPAEEPPTEGPGEDPPTDPDEPEEV